MISVNLFRSDQGEAPKSLLYEQVELMWRQCRHRSISLQCNPNLGNPSDQPCGNMMH